MCMFWLTGKIISVMACIYSFWIFFVFLFTAARVWCEPPSVASRDCGHCCQIDSRVWHTGVQRARVRNASTQEIDQRFLKRECWGIQCPQKNCVGHHLYPTWNEAIFFSPHFREFSSFLMVWITLSCSLWILMCIWLLYVSIVVLFAGWIKELALQLLEELC